MKLYKYTLLKQDGTTQDLGISKKKDFQEFYKVLNCSVIQIIPTAYYNGLKYGRCTMFGDEEGRFNNKKNITNPHFKKLKDEVFGGEDWDIVGDIIKEEVAK